MKHYRQDIGAKLPKFRDPAIPAQEIDRLIRRGDTRALSNPNISLQTLLQYAQVLPAEIEANPALDMIVLEDPYQGTQLRRRLNFGWRVNVLKHMDINTQINVVADWIEHALPIVSDDPALVTLARDCLVVMRKVAAPGQEIWDSEVHNLWPRIKKMMERYGTTEVLADKLRHRYFLGALRWSLGSDFQYYTAGSQLLIFIPQDEGVYNSPQSIAEAQAQADIVRRYYYAKHPILPAMIKRPRKSSKVGAVAPFGISDQTKNPNPSQLAAFQVVAPSYARNFEGLWDLYLLENPNLEVTAGVESKNKSLVVRQVYTYESAFSLLEDPNNIPLPHEEMCLFFADCLEWMLRHEDDARSRDAIRYAVRALRSESGYILAAAARIAKATRADIIHWYPEEKHEIWPLDAIMSIMHWAMGAASLHKEFVLRKLAWSNVNIVSEIYSGGQMEARMEAYRAFSGFLESRLQALQGGVVAGKVKPTKFPTLKQFLALSQEKQDEIRNNNDTFLPSDMVGKRVYIHLNLGSKWASRGLGTWSVKYGPKRKLVGHVYGLRLQNVAFEVSPTENMEAVVARDKGVHAFAVGDIVEAHMSPDWKPSTNGFIPLRYSPDRSEDFFFMMSSDGKRWDTPVSGATEILAIGGIGRPLVPAPSRGWRFTFPWKPILATGVQDMPVSEIQEGLEERRQAFLSHHDQWEESRRKKEEADLSEQGHDPRFFHADLEKAKKARWARFSRLGQSPVVGRRRRGQLPSIRA